MKVVYSTSKLCCDNLASQQKSDNSIFLGMIFVFIFIDNKKTVQPGLGEETRTPATSTRREVKKEECVRKVVNGKKV